MEFMGLNIYLMIKKMIKNQPRTVSDQSKCSDGMYIFIHKFIYFLFFVIMRNTDAYGVPGSRGKSPKTPGMKVFLRDTNRKFWLLFLDCSKYNYYFCVKFGFLLIN